MKIIRFIDIVDSTINEEGAIEEKVLYGNFTLPTTIDPTRISTISPLFSGTGILYKNVSIIKYGDELMKVLGSVDYLNKLQHNKRIPIGFKNGEQKQATIEDRAEIKSTVKRRTKRSSK